MDFDAGFSINGIEIVCYKRGSLVYNEYYEEHNINDVLTCKVWCKKENGCYLEVSVPEYEIRCYRSLELDEEDHEHRGELEINLKELFERCNKTASDEKVKVCIRIMSERIIKEIEEMEEEMNRRFGRNITKEIAEMPEEMKRMLCKDLLDFMETLN